MAFFQLWKEYSICTGCPTVNLFFWPFLALWPLDHFFSLATWKYKQNTSFSSRSYIPILLRPAFSFESREKKAKLWNHCASWLLVLNKKKGHFWNQHEKLHRFKRWCKRNFGKLTHPNVQRGRTKTGRLEMSFWFLEMPLLAFSGTTRLKSKQKHQSNATHFLEH